MAKKTPKGKAKKAAPQKAAKSRASKPNVSYNIYTIMSFIAMVMIAWALGFVLYRSTELFGSVGDLFKL